MKIQQHFLTKIPLGMLLTIPFLLQLVGAVGLVAYLSNRSGERAINTLANQLMNQVSVRIAKRLELYLETPHQIIKLNQVAVAQGKLNVADFSQLEQHFYQQLQIFPSLTTLSFGNVRGEVLGVGRDRHGVVTTPNTITIWDKQGAAPGVRRFYQVDEKQNRLKVIHVTPNFDSRQRLWYQAARQADKQIWTPVFPVFNLPVAAISAVTPVYLNGELQGVFNSDLLLEDISLFLDSLDFSPSGQTFIVEPTGELIASSTQEQLFHKQGKELIRLRSVDSQNSLTRAVAGEAIVKWQDLNQISVSQRFSFLLDKQRQFVQITPYQNSYGLNWLIVTVISETDFLADVRANNKRTLLLCGLTLFSATIIGIWTARAIATPIRRLQQAATAISEGQLKRQIKVGGVGEVARLSIAFEQIARQLDDVLIVFRDLTERKTAELELQESEEQFRRAFENTPIGTAIVACRGKFLKVNSSLSNIVGYSKSELLTLTLEDITALEDRERVAEIEQRMLANHHQVIQKEICCVDKSGNTVRCLLSLSLVKDRKVKPLYFIAQIQDLSERDKIDRLKDEFISIVSHELRTPLTAIKGSLGLLNTGFYNNKSDTAKELLQIALNNSERMVCLVNDILDLERLESGKFKLVKEKCDLPTLLNQATESVKVLADRANIELIVHSCSYQISATPNAIVQTLTNLLSNAIKFSPAGSTIWLTAELITNSSSSLLLKSESQDSDKTKAILFQVKDRGQGIPQDKLSTIFDRFQQVNISDSRDKGGTGLGLAICKSIVEQHGGRIWVESELGWSSTFFFTIPLSNHE